MNTKSLLARVVVPVLSLGLLGGAALATAGAASASTGPNGNTQQTTGGNLTGHNAATYPDPFFGGVKCNETQHPAFDTVSCKSTTGLPLLNVTPGETDAVIGWNSDFGDNGTTSIRHNQGVLTFTVSADGLSYTGQATYPNG